MAKGQRLPVEDSYGDGSVFALTKIIESLENNNVGVSTCPKIRQRLSSVVNLIQRSVPGRVSHQ